MVGREVVFRLQREQLEAGPPVLDMQDLTATNDFGREVVRGVSLSLHQSEILGLAGVAGNGQKELFEVLVGVRHATGGRLRLAGDDITDCTPQQIMRRGVGYIPDDRIRAGLVPDFTVGENLILGRQRDRAFLDGPLLSEPKIERYSQRCIAGYEIATPSWRHRTRFLSGGNLQKVILARELDRELRVLLANQPTRGLDVGVTEYVYRRLLEKRQQGLGILLASEDLDDLLDLCDRIAVMFRGQIMGVFRPREVDRVEIGLLMAGVRADAP
jgi:simple sugar transport system ATP-binding protein